MTYATAKRWSRKPSKTDFPQAVVNKRKKASRPADQGSARNDLVGSHRHRASFELSLAATDVAIVSCALFDAAEMARNGNVPSIAASVLDGWARVMTVLRRYKARP